MSEHSEPFRLAAGHTQATEWGARFTRSQNQLLAELPVITSVGLCNVCEVRSHDVVRVAGFVSHCVSFLDGGELRFAYSDRGELIELHCLGISVAVTQDGRVMAGMRGSPALPGSAE